MKDEKDEKERKNEGRREGRYEGQGDQQPSCIEREAWKRASLLFPSLLNRVLIVEAGDGKAIARQDFLMLTHVPPIQMGRG